MGFFQKYLQKFPLDFFFIRSLARIFSTSFWKLVLEFLQEFRNTYIISLRNSSMNSFMGFSKVAPKDSSKNFSRDFSIRSFGHFLRFLQDFLQGFLQKFTYFSQILVEISPEVPPGNTPYRLPGISAGFRKFSRNCCLEFLSKLLQKTLRKFF